MNSSDTKNHPDELESDSTAPSTPEEDETVLEKEPAGPLNARPAVAQSLSVSMALSRQLATAPIIQTMEALESTVGHGTYYSNDGGLESAVGHGTYYSNDGGT